FWLLTSCATLSSFRGSLSPKQKSRRSIPARRLSVIDFFLTSQRLNILNPSTSPLAHAERIERRLIDHRRRLKSLIGLISGQRLPSQRPEQSIHLALVIAHLLKLSLHVRDHAIRRLGPMTDIDRRIISIILGARIVTPRRIPVAAVPVVVTATDQLDALVTRVVPIPIVPFRMIRTKRFVLRTR